MIQLILGQLRNSTWYFCATVTLKLSQQEPIEEPAYFKTASRAENAIQELNGYKVPLGTVSKN